MPERVKTVVDAVIEGKDIGMLGEQRINVLLLNLALDRQFGRPAPAQAKERKDSDVEDSANVKPATVSDQIQ